MIPLKQRVVRAAIHVPVGVLTVMAGVIHWVFPIVLTWGFLAYEKNEDRNIKDAAFYDIFGWLIGVCATVIYFIWRIICKYISGHQFF